MRQNSTVDCTMPPAHRLESEGYPGVSKHPSAVGLRSGLNIQAWAGAARSGSPVGTQVASHSFEFPRHLACRRGASPARVPSDRQERVCVSVWLRVCAGRLPGSVLGWYASGMHSGPW